MIVITGIIAFLSVWRMTTTDWRSPLAVAVRTKSWRVTSNICERNRRMIAALEANAPARAGNSMIERLRPGSSTNERYAVWLKLGVQLNTLIVKRNISGARKNVGTASKPIDRMRKI